MFTPLKYSCLNKIKLANWAKRQGYIVNYDYDYSGKYKEVVDRYILVYDYQQLLLVEEKEKELNTKTLQINFL